MKHTPIVCATLSLAASLTSPAVSHAQEAPQTLAATGAQTTPASASDNAPARRYAHGSISLYGSAYVSYRSASNSEDFVLELGPHARFVLPSGLALGVALEPGVSHVVPRGGSVPFSQWSLTFGARVAAGWAFALSDRVAFTPMVGYRLGARHDVPQGPATGAPTTEAVTHAAVVSLPVTVYLARNVFYEPAVEVWMRDDPAFGFSAAVVLSQGVGVTF